MTQYWLDYQKVLAILAVLIVHITSPIYLSFGEIADAQWWSANILNAASRFCVPLFVMISGALLLGREMSIANFYKKRSVRILPAFAFWSVFFLIFSLFTSPKAQDMGVFYFVIDSAIRGLTYYHLWYLSMFVCLMLFAPFMNKFVLGQKLERREVVVLFVLFCLFMFLQQVAVFGKEAMDRDMKWFREFPWYVCYFVMGYYIREYADSIKISPKILAGIVIILTGIGVVQNYYFITFFDLARDWAALPSNGISVLLITVCIFTIFAKIQNSLPALPAVSFVAKCSFGIYLIHPFFLYYLKLHLWDVIDNKTLYIALVLPLLFALSCAAVFVMRLFKPLRYIC